MNKSAWCVMLGALLTLWACEPAPPPEAPTQEPSQGEAADKAAPPTEQGWSYLQRAPQEATPGTLSQAEQARVKELLQGQATYETVQLLTAHGTGIKPFVADMLEHEDALWRSAGVQLVNYLNLSDLHGKLEQTLQDKDARVRRASVEAIARRGGPAQARWLEARLTDPEQFLRFRSLQVMAEHGDRGLVPTARAEAEVQQRVWKLRALEGLARVALPEDLPWFKAQLGAKDGSLSYNELVPLWRGAAADPEAGYKLLQARGAREEGSLVSPRRELHAALWALTPHVPTEALLQEWDASFGDKNKLRMFRLLVRAAAATPDPAVQERVDQQRDSKRYACDIIGGPLEAEQQWSQQVELLRRSLERAQPEARADLERALKLRQADLEALRPLADRAMRDFMGSLSQEGKGCRGEIRGMIPARLEALVEATKDKSPLVRGRAAQWLSREGGWEQLPALAALLRDEDASVRREARDALRILVGMDLRTQDAYLWEGWWARSFGELPQAAFPVKDAQAALASDFQEELKARPLPSPSISSSDSGDTMVLPAGPPGTAPVSRPASSPARP